jgi:hypothetical protein
MVVTVPSGGGCGVNLRGYRRGAGFLGAGGGKKEKGSKDNANGRVISHISRCGTKMKRKL